MGDVMSTIEERLTAIEEGIARLKHERAGAKLDDVSQMLRSLRFDSDEQRKATHELRHEIIGLRADFERRVGRVETLLVAIAAHLGVGGEA
jgi:hypothetical protein